MHEMLVAQLLYEIFERSKIQWFSNVLTHGGGGERGLGAWIKRIHIRIGKKIGILMKQECFGLILELE